MSAWQTSKALMVSLEGHTSTPDHLENRISRLCTYCQVIADDWPAYDESFISSKRFNNCKSKLEMHASALDGCPLCTQITQTTPEIYCASLRDSNDDYITIRSGYEPRIDQREGIMWKLTLTRWCNSPEFQGYKISCLIVQEIKMPNQTFMDTQRTNSSTESGLPAAKQWLRNCCDQHVSCTARKSGYTPSRLIDVLAKPRLCVQNSTDGKLTYATLSYCWGSSKFSVLEKATLMEFCKEIPSSAISKTFHDAFKVTRELGIRYLWIDSLCIIQDDDEDWRTQSALMTNVYGCATLNLAATGAEDGRDGLFFSRPGEIDCQFHATVGNRHKTVLRCYSSKFADALHGPLSSRGWALQERLIPTRNLFFTQTQLFWQCSTLEAWELHPKGLLAPSYVCYDGRTPVTLANWPEIVLWYSRCQITFSHDKLVAIAGIARLIAQKEGGVYLAGLWQEDIEFQLLWRTQSQPTVPFAYRAPSWSWASVDGPTSCGYSSINRSSERESLMIKCLHTSVTLKAPNDTFGEVIAARMHVACSDMRFLKLKCRKINSSVFLCLDSDSDERDGYRIKFDASFDRMAEQPVEGEYTNVCLLPVVRELDMLFRGLIIQPTGRARGEYQRIGIWWRFHDGGQRMTDSFAELLAQNATAAELAGDGNVDDDIFAEIRTMEDGTVQKVIVLV